MKFAAQYSMQSRDVHGNGKCGIPIPPMGFPWEWTPNCLNKEEWDGNRNNSDGNGNAYY